MWWDCEHSWFHNGFYTSFSASIFLSFFFLSVSANNILHLFRKFLKIEPSLSCWPKTNRLQGVSPAKMGLFGICRELQFKVYNHGEPHASLHATREAELFYRGEKGLWECYSKQRFHDFSLANLLPEKESVPSVGLCSQLRGIRALPSGLPTLFNWGFCLLVFYISPSWLRFFSESITDEELGSVVSAAFCPSVSEGIFLRLVSMSEGK